MSTSSFLTRAVPDGGHELRRRNAELEAEVGALRAELAALTCALRGVEAISRRTAGAAHDLRNALTVILGEADNLAHCLQDRDERESARALADAARLAATLTQDLLLAARGPEHRPERREGEVDGAELLARCERLARRVLTPAFRCELAIEAGLWPICTRAELLESALLNLVANARDAMPAGGLLRLGARNVPRGAPPPCGLPPGSYVAFCVEDAGLGMSPDVLARATEAFFTTKSPDRGTGLGLAMVSAFATGAGGALHLSSELGRGTRAEILLPRAPGRAAPLGADDRRQAVVERIRRRARTPWLVDVLDAWCQVARPGGLPRPEPLEAALAAHASCTLVLAVDVRREPPELRLVRLGRDLVELLERSALRSLSLNGPELFGSLASTYRHAVRSRCPTYQFARHRWGRGAQAQLERLVLPAASDDETVSHLFGVVLLSVDEATGDHEPDT